MKLGKVNGANLIGEMKRIYISGDDYSQELELTEETKKWLK